MRRVLAVLIVALFSLGAGTIAVAGAGPVGPTECPDYDNDGICNGDDPDYVPGDQCSDPDCGNPDCPDADGDGICNGQDPDYTPPGGGSKHQLRNMWQFVVRAFFGAGDLLL